MAQQGEGFEISLGKPALVLLTFLVGPGSYIPGAENSWSKQLLCLPVS